MNVLKLPTVGWFFLKPILFVCLQILDPKDGFSSVFFFPKGEIQIQKVSDYVSFQSP
jgi:hypothetical protein